MGHAAYTRGSRAIASHIEQEGDEPCGLSRRELSNFRTLLGNTQDRLERQRQRADSAEAELERARFLIQRLRAEKAVLRDEITHEQKQTKLANGLASGIYRSLKATRHAHWKLSRIMRWALTPEQYHQARQECGEVHKF